MKKNVIEFENQLSLLDCGFCDDVASDFQSEKPRSEEINPGLKKIPLKKESTTRKTGSKEISVRAVVENVAESNSIEKKSNSESNSSESESIDAKNSDKKKLAISNDSINTKNSDEKKLAILVDGSNFIYRAFYALPQLTSPDGNPVGAVYGFCSMLISLLGKHKSDLFCVALDAGRDTFRKEIYPEYKNNREETPADLKSQFPILIEACHAFGIPIIETVGYEADDIIATIATKLSQQNYEVRIIASDKDLMQLINENIYLFDPIKSKVIKENEVAEKYGVAPHQMVSLQALMGDSTDNIPGIQGVGPKTAAKLLNQFQSLKNIYDEIENVVPTKLREKLITQRNMVEISEKLVTLCRSVPIDKNFSDLKINLDTERTKNFLSKYNFNSLVKRLEKQSNQIEQKQRRYLNLSRSDDLENFLKMNRAKKFSIFSTTCFNQSEILVICTESHVVSCFFIRDEDEKNLLTEKNVLSYGDLQEVLNPYLENESVEKIGLRGALRLFPNMKSFNDIGAMGYLLHGIIGNKISDLFPENDSYICKFNFSEVCNTEQCCLLASLMFDEFENFRAELVRNNLMDIYQKIDMPLIPILNEMEAKGVLVSKEKLQNFAEELKEKIKKLESELFAISGREFNPASGKQLSKLLFDELKIPKPSKKNSLDIESLEELYGYSPIPKLVVEWRKLSKLLSTYTYSLCDLLNPETNRLHTRFNVTATSTGRLSSSNPNLQNIPHRTEQGRKIRSAFISPHASKLVSFDYSQIELRVLAHMANIKFLKDAFLKNLDIHQATASQIFDVNLENVTPEMRARAKTINFGIIYGMSHFRLAKNLNISNSEAKNYIRSYFQRFPEFEKFRDDVLNFARKNGYVETLIGRRCFSKEINAKNPMLRQFGERQAFNAIIQGTAADIVKIAMIKVSKILQNFHSDMILQIHDELVFEVPNEFVENIIPSVKSIMENAYHLSVPLFVESKYGDYLR
ncbi:MAG: DNA polymerase I [Alphaproteobacteria bacterium]|nr:DNA polymerase I [Alphaproteobacteria bacterium]